MCFVRDASSPFLSITLSLSSPALRHAYNKPRVEWGKKSERRPGPDRRVQKDGMVVVTLCVCCCCATNNRNLVRV
jgi:hypothetical protein